MGSELASLIARLKSPLPVCPFDSRSPDYWTTSNDKPCHVCGGTEEVDKCRGADTRCMDEAATTLSAQEEQIERLLAELDETFTDEKGNVWHRPTAWAYYAACRALDAAKAALEGSKRDG